MKTLVDTSVWSLALRKKGHPDHMAVKMLAALLQRNENIVLVGVVLQEILQAFRNDSTFQKLTEYFAPVPILPLDRDVFISAAKLHRKCASKGIASTTIDCLIAAAAIKYDCVLLTADKDFELIAKHSKLKIA